ncbi:MAG: cupin domain-containing protein [Bacteroidota bacterium]|jgi:mannose-6-phosphate isomerase-like protein (cupin superfamily)
MIKFSTVLLLILTQKVCIAQFSCTKLDTISPPDNLENVFVKPLYMDSAEVSSYLIFIKKEVKPHKHMEHAEHVYVTQGEGLMTLGDKEFKIKMGSFIFIPKNTFHSVITTSEIPLKVISIQAPYFDGKDRVFKE